jgi:hypothetical protein
MPLGINVGGVDSDDVLSVTISGVPSFESITAAGTTPTVTQNGNTFSYTFNALPASDWNNGLVVNSTYTGKSRPTNTFTVTASNTTLGESATATAAGTISVTDPVQTTVQNPVGAPPNSPPGLDHVVALFSQFAAGFSDQHGNGALNTNPLSQIVTNQEQFLANPHHG